MTDLGQSSRDAPINLANARLSTDSMIRNTKGRPVGRPFALQQSRV
jgi:hypothetical protein